MSIDKYVRLYDKFPLLLSKNTAINCDEGLYSVVEGMLAAVKVYEEANLGKTSLIPTVFHSIEIKFGCLDIHYSGGDDVVREIISFSKTLSFKTCEMCGKLGKLYCSTKWTNWSNKKTLCKKHAIELYYYSIT